MESRKHRTDMYVLTIAGV